MSISIAAIAPLSLNEFQCSLFVVYAVALSRLDDAKRGTTRADVDRWNDAIEAIRKAWPDDILAIEHGMRIRS